MIRGSLPRYSYAGAEYIFVEISEDMDLVTNLKIHAICRSIKEEAIQGVIEAYPGNTTFLIHYNPEEIRPDALIKKIQNFIPKSEELVPFASRLIEVPVLYNDPWTIECAKKFALGHQDPSVTNLVYVAKINGLSVPEFIKAHTSSQYLMTMKRFLPGSLSLLQMVERSKTLSCPKYIIPRTWSPVRSLVMGGIYTAVSPFGSPGGYQLLGRSPVPMYDPERKLLDLKDGILARSSDRFKLRLIEMDEYKAIRASVKAGDYRFKIVEQRFELLKYFENPEIYLKSLEDELRDV